MEFIEAWQSTGWTFGKVMTIFWFAILVLVALEDTINVIAAGDWIYYINTDDGGSIYRVKIDGSGRTRLNKTRTSVFNILGHKIFYLAENDVL